MATLNTQRTSDHSNHIMAFLESRFIDHLKQELHLVPMGLKKTLAQHMGKTVKWNQHTAIAASTTALTEGVSPDGIALASSNYTATIAGYGQYVTVSDYLDMAAINDTMKDAVDLLSYAASLSLDSLVRAELQANGTQRYADAASNSSKANVETGTDRLRSDELKIIAKSMRVANARPFENDLFKGVINPLMEADLLAETAASSFIVLSAHNGSGNQVIEKGEIGTAFGIKLVRSTNIIADATSTNTYGNIFLSKDAFGVVDLASAGTKIIVKPHGSAGTEDPLDQRATVGYKTYFATKIFEVVRTQIMWAYSA